MLSKLRNVADHVMTSADQSASFRTFHSADYFRILQFRTLPTPQQQRDSVSGDTSGVDDISVSHLNDDLFPSTLSAADDESERSSALHTEGGHSVLVKTEPSVDDTDNDAVLMESDVKSLISSNIPLSVIQGMNEYEDDGPCHTPLSPVSKKRRTFHSSISLGGIPASVKNLLDDELHNAHVWSGHSSCAPSSDAASLPLAGESDTSHVAPHTSFQFATRSQALVSH